VNPFTRTFVLLAGLLAACAHPEGAAGPTFVNPSGRPSPKGLTHAVSVPAGRTVYVSGQVARNEQGQIVGRGDMRVQAEQVFKNIDAALGAAGAKMSDVVQLTAYLRDISQLAAYREVRERVLGDHPRPASTLVEVKGFIEEDILLEVDVIAAPRD
jgi:enamine deaminase RidA (YjgF/YER057c/UK114 family)